MPKKAKSPLRKQVAPEVDSGSESDPESASDSDSQILGTKRIRESPRGNPPVAVEIAQQATEPSMPSATAQRAQESPDIIQMGNVIEKSINKRPSEQLSSFMLQSDIYVLDELTDQTTKRFLSQAQQNTIADYKTVITPDAIRRIRFRLMNNEHKALNESDKQWPDNLSVIQIALVLRKIYGKKSVVGSNTLEQQCLNFIFEYNILSEDVEDNCFIKYQTMIEDNIAGTQLSLQAEQKLAKIFGKKLPKNTDLWEDFVRLTNEELDDTVFKTVVRVKGLLSDIRAIYLKAQTYCPVCTEGEHPLYGPQ